MPSSQPPATSGSADRASTDEPCVCMADRLTLLRGVVPFQRLAVADLTALAAVMHPVSMAAGVEIVREGEPGSAMYVLVSGSARVMHRDVQLGSLAPGAHFGEVALAVGGNRSATVITQEPCTLLFLDETGLSRLTVNRPMLAIELLREVISSTSSHLARMNESVSLLLQARALPRRVDLNVDINGVTYTVRTGTAADELLPQEVAGVPVVAALVDGRARSLASPLVGSCSLAPLTTAHWEGERIFRQSLGLATLEAARSIGLSIRLGPSLGFAQRLDLDPTITTDQARCAAANSLQDALTSLVKSDKSLIRQRLSVLEAVDYFERDGADHTVALLETTRHRTVAVVAYGEVFTLETGPLLPSTGRLSGFEIVPDGAHLLLVYAVKGHQRAVPNALPETERAAVRECRPPIRLARRISAQVAKMTATQQVWLRTLQMGSVGDFNRACIHGAVEPLIRVAEGFHEKRIGHIADAIAARREQVRLISIAGPSSSGKTTFIRRLSVQLQVNGLQPVALGLDDYYVDRTATPRGADGEYDFESIDALQLDLLHSHLVALVSGEPVKTARYDFRAGKSHPAGGPEMQLNPGDLLLIEGIHGLNPLLAAALPPERVFRIFVCPLIQLPIDRLTQVHASDLRLLRRIVRDRHCRAIRAAETIARWPNVRRGERLHIFPFQHHADAIFDTSLVYELSVLKVFAERYLLEVPAADPAQATAERLLDLLDSWVTIYPDHVPPTSLLREFIGGSGFTY